MLYLAFKNLISKPFNTFLSILLFVLSISLITFVLQLKDQLHQQLDKFIKPFDLVIGVIGSALQLILSSVLHIDNPTGNISFDEALKITKNPMVREAIPISYGDNYKGYRILGTSEGYLNRYKASLSKGKLYNKPFEAVVGYQVAQKTNLTVGKTFVSAHGLTANGIEAHEEKPFVVTGVLKPTGTVVDHLIITKLESIWEVHEHEGEHDHHDDHDEPVEITSMLLKFRNPIGAIQLSRFVNKNTKMQAAFPKLEIDRLIGFLGIGIQTINGIAIMILLVAGLSMFINLIKTVRERKQELALIRTYGANTFQLIKLVFLEALFLSVLGFALGWIIGRI